MEVWEDSDEAVRGEDEKMRASGCDVQAQHRDVLEGEAANIVT